MPNRIIATLSILVSLLLSGCGGKQTQSSKGEVVDLSGIWDKPEDIKLSDFADGIEYIPLETSPECLLGEPKNLRVTVLENYIAISSKGLRLFNRQGKYLRTIGAIGKGPHEYSGSSNYVIDEKTGKVDIVDNSRLAVFSYRITGEFIGSFKIKPYTYYEITRDSDDRLGLFCLAYRENTQDSTRQEWLSDSGELLKSIPVYRGRPNGGGAFMALMMNLYWSGNELMFNENPFDTIYQLAGDRSWEPRWIINVGSNHMPAEISMDINRFNATLDQYNLAKICLESERYLFFGAHSIKAQGMAVYDKKEHKATWIKGEKSEDPEGQVSILNDLDGGLALQPNLWYPENPSDKYFITLISPLDLITKYKEHPKSETPVVKPELRETLFTLTDRLHEDDNPVVMIVRLKK